MALTKKYGLVGTAIGRSCTMVVLVLTHIIVVTWFLKVKFNWSNLVKPVLIFVPAGLIFLMAQVILKNTYIAGFLLLASYLILAWKIMFKAEEKKFLISSLPAGVKNIVEKNQLFFD